MFALRYYSSYAAMWITSLSTVVYFFRKDFHKLRWVFAMLGLINAIYIIGQTLAGYPFLERAGFFLNGTISGVFIAFTIPFFFDGKKYVAIGAALIAGTAVVMTKTSVPVGAFSLALVAYGLKYLKNKKIVMSIVGTVSTIFTISYFYDPGLFSSAKRFLFYEYSFDYFATKLNHWFGSGTGTFMMFGQEVQKTYSFSYDPITRAYSEMMIFMHNDYLETLFSLGVIGFVLLLWAILKAVLSTYKRGDYALLSCQFGYIGSMLFDYPFRYAPHCIIGGYLLCYGLRDSRYRKNNLEEK